MRTVFTGPQGVFENLVMVTKPGVTGRYVKAGSRTRFDDAMSPPISRKGIR